MKRRAVLGAVGASALAGCASLSGPSGADPACSDAEPRSLRSCARDDFVRFDPTYGTLSIGTGASSFALHASDRRVRIGEGITFTLTNTAWLSSAETGNRRKYSIDRLVEDGWRSVYAYDETDRGVGFTDEAIAHRGRGGFAWEFTATAEGLAHHNDGLVVCPEVERGWHRFVYWGLGEEALGACFEIVRE